MLKNQKILLPRDHLCAPCSKGKLIIKSSPSKIVNETPNFLEQIQGDTCGPIHPSSGPFNYFIVLVDASTRWPHVCLVFSRNVAFAKLLAQIIRLQAQFSNYPIKSFRFDNASEFSSWLFNEFYMSLRITIEHPVAHVHIQNSLAESFIKRISVDR